jgi:Flp pilus assembly protein TadG
MALVLILLSMLLFGIIAFGYLMSFKQNMTQAATEGARAGAVATGSASQKAAAAQAAAEKALSSFGQSCTSTGMTCTISATVSCPNAASGYCISVQLSFDYQNHPLLPTVPFVGALMPNTIAASASAETNS